MKIYLRLLKFLKPYRLRLFIAIACMVGFALTNGAMAYLIGPVLKFLFTSDPSAEIRIVPFDLVTIPREEMIVAIPLLIIAVAVTKGLCSFGQSFYMGYVGQRVVTDLREKLYRHILNLPVDYFSKNPTGVLMSRLTNDVNLLHNTTADALTTVFKQSLTIVVLVAVVVGMDWKLALAALVAFPLAIYPMIRLGRKMKRVSTKGQVTMGAMSALLHEAIAGVRIVKAFCMEPYELRRFRDENERFTRYKLKTIKVQSISSPLMETLGAVGFAVTIWYAAYRINNGTLAPEAFVSFFAAVLMLYQPIKALNGVHLNIQNGLAAASRVFELLDLTPEAGSWKGQKIIDGLKESVEFKNVSFGYGTNRVLKDINLKVKKGEKVAIVGTSGAGKTTLVNLIPGFYEVTGGAILIDGVDIREISLESLRSQVAIISQQVVLFNDTVRRNIAYGDFSRSDEEIIRAAKAANAHGFISKLPRGYDTLIGEGGVRLSGGERQRLSIARAILKDAPILIMDEATSSLDTESEMEVQKGLENLMEGRTTFIIAHRLSTIRNADRIVVLMDGTIKETGRHEELLGRNGEYSRLYYMQFHGTKEGIAT